MKNTLKAVLALGCVVAVATAVAIIVEELCNDTLEDPEPTLDEDDDGIEGVDGDCLADEDDDDYYYTKDETVTPADSEDETTSTDTEGE